MHAKRWSSNETSPRFRIRPRPTHGGASTGYLKFEKLTCKAFAERECAGQTSLHWKAMAVPSLAACLELSRNSIHPLDVAGPFQLKVDW